MPVCKGQRTNASRKLLPKENDLRRLHDLLAPAYQSDMMAETPQEDHDRGKTEGRPVRVPFHEAGHQDALPQTSEYEEGAVGDRDANESLRPPAHFHCCW